MCKTELCFEMLEVIPFLREAMRAERAVRKGGLHWDDSGGCDGTG
jgi:hypothetical protein